MNRKEKSCNSCSGYGKKRCHKCHGNIGIPQNQGGRMITVKCSLCCGTGNISCTDCFGRGKRYY